MQRMSAAAVTDDMDALVEGDTLSMNCLSMFPGGAG